MIIRLFISGLIFLFLSVLLNLVASFLRLSSWYDFLKAVSAEGLSKGLSSMSLPSLVWLFLVYPFCLGVFVLVVRRITNI